ncbi:hypothetical protein E5676_scaffold130G002050 [Cucumis melo var. makuwa]|uniref:Uncharacterized protein n=2 Tax=Cucumis melo TaxID=3656 RepID=A0A5D3CZS3_CUCMM|nr:hypothetical protein E6C27_scaffold46G002740 [Cucumis melo var. makuwa]TYK17052.1 hypothetical protein E5676_scaffold130G002050 [Cucumis melo var. makuwa]
MSFRINSPSTRKLYRKSIGREIGDVGGCKSEKMAVVEYRKEPGREFTGSLQA